MRLKYIRDEKGDRFESSPITEPNGTTITHSDAGDLFCPCCNEFITGFSMIRQFQSFKVLNGAAYCFDHYPKAVDVYLADLKLKESVGMEKEKSR